MVSPAKKGKVTDFAKAADQEGQEFLPGTLTSAEKAILKQARVVKALERQRMDLTAKEKDERDRLLELLDEAGSKEVAFGGVTAYVDEGKRKAKVKLDDEE